MLYAGTTSQKTKPSRCTTRRLAHDRLGEDRASMDKGVKLAVLTTRVNACRQVGKKLLVILPTRKGGVERSRVQTNDDRLKIRPR